MAKITVSFIRDLEKQVCTGDISYSRMAEILNEQARSSYKDNIEFYKTKTDKVLTRGERYFKVNNKLNVLTQVCLEVNNDTKRGKGHYKGIYLISRTTFYTNWFPDFVEDSTEDEYNSAFNEAVKMLGK